MATISRATGGDLVLEAKFNGEQLGPPYPAAGASMAGDWRAYSYEGYLDAPEGYRFVYQVRAGGTHRIFREANLAYMRRLMPTTTHAGAEGFSFEFAHAFFAQRDYYHRDADRFSPWTFTRDAMSYLMAGRLAYDPTTSEQVFRDALRARAGTDALWAPMQSASEVVPWIVSSLVCGPDHREDSPELEWHGDVAYWAQAPARQVQVAQHACAGRQGPFDAFAVAGPYETAQAILGAAVEPRVTTREVAEIVLRASQGAGLAADAQVDGAEARDVARECVALGDLGAYHGHKLRAATALAVYQGSGDAAWLAFARDESRAAVDAWRRLAVHTDHIAPFEDNLRTTPVLFGRRTIHWRDQLDLVATDAAAIDRVEAEVRARPPAGRARMSPAAWLATSRPLASHAPSSWRVEPAAGGGWSAALAFDKDPGDDVEVVALYKPVSALVDWRRAPMRREGGRFVAALPDTGRGVMTAVEVTWRAEGVAARWPDATRETPWRLTLR